MFIALVVLVAIAVVTALGMIPFMNGLRGYFSSKESPTNQIATVSEQSPEALLETHPSMDLKAHQAHETLLLNSYGWTDKETATAHIPIHRAMELKLKKGFPWRAKS